ncbi:DUF4436 domain-containing protein [Mycobacterium sp. SP-6446]|uniref:DUF4436 domain-containing protein n=1 Tax=Mycobacterium sp. SP-6446 TaxID=1834162 RepID=UPI00096E5B68|nr:DUF4436 domain-containing protein [Mycobacterium sp. SP-6446]OMC14686.1 DUF4436 domain-containing protein [Mycobacterium sp. SP-6446]
MRLRIVGLVVVFVAAYITTMTLYARSGCGCPIQLTQGQPAADGTTVTINFDELQSVKGVLNANVTVTPGPDLLDQRTGGLKEDLGVRVHSAAMPTKREWSKGTVPGVFSVALPVVGDPSDWPFDRYDSGPVTVDLFRGAAEVPERTWVKFVDRVPGWRLDIPVGSKAGVPEPYRVELHRSPSTAVFAAVMVAVLIALAGVGVWVAAQTARDRRLFQPPMTTWYAAMLFAVIPLRNALPDAPPLGSWIDVSVVLWVIVALVGSMLLYLSCWWRHLKPDIVDTPTV